jgi:hypothetical protein
MKTRSNLSPCIRQALFLTVVLSVASAYSKPNQGSGTNDAKKMEASEKRDPFWPVGYVPERIKNAALTDAQKTAKRLDGSKDWNSAMKQIVINGISSRANDEFIAVINGQIKSVGEHISVTQGGSVFTWAVDSIAPPGSVKLRRVSVK